MGASTDIEYADSTANPILGCNGCELWNNKTKICYAGKLATRYAGSGPWPSEFTRPVLNPIRLDNAIKLSDLTGKPHPGKPWLDGLPRIIFLNDLSDTFTEDIDPNTWLTPRLEAMAASPHIWLILTKRTRRALRYFDSLPFIPTNFRIGTSITSKSSAKRLEYMSMIKDVIEKAARRNTWKRAKTWLSIEPLLTPINLDPNLLKSIDWVAMGGVSGHKEATRAAWLQDAASQILAAGIPLFFKQWGSIQSNPNKGDLTAKENGGKTKGGQILHGRLYLEQPSGE